MARPYISEAVRRRVREAGGQRCAYCLTDQTITAMPLHVEHIIPVAAQGSSAEANLCLACPLCNGFKGAQTHHADPDTSEQVPLFNPRLQLWSEHFQWSEDGTHILGQTPVGRATILALQLNNAFLTRARRRWVMVGWHPPST